MDTVKLECHHPVDNAAAASKGTIEVAHGVQELIDGPTDRPIDTVTEVGVISAAKYQG